MVRGLALFLSKFINISLAYADPVQVHQMLIDERMSANKRQLEFQRLNEELNRLHNQLDEVQERHREQEKGTIVVVELL